MLVQPLEVRTEICVHAQCTRAASRHLLVVSQKETFLGTIMAMKMCRHSYTCNLPETLDAGVRTSTTNPKKLLDFRNTAAKCLPLMGNPPLTAQATSLPKAVCYDAQRHTTLSSC